MQNKCIGYCVHLAKVTYIPKNKFETLKWLPIKDRFNQAKNLTTFKYFSNQCPCLLNEVFKLGCRSSLRAANSYLKSTCPFQKTKTGQNVLSFISTSI